MRVTDARLYAHSDQDSELMQAFKLHRDQRVRLICIFRPSHCADQDGGGGGVRVWAMALSASYMIFCDTGPGYLY